MTCPTRETIQLQQRHAFNAGIVARRMDMPLSACPYLSEMHAHLNAAWKAGWADQAMVMLSAEIIQGKNLETVELEPV